MPIKKLRLHGPIYGGPFPFPSEINSAKLKAELDQLSADTELEITLTTPGGSVFESVVMADLLSSWEAKVTVICSGIVASGGTLIALAADNVYITSLSFFMIHGPATFTFGDIQEHERALNLLKAIESSIAENYAENSTLTVKKARAAMVAETWYTAKEALEVGFIDKIINQKKLSEEESASIEQAKNLHSKDPEMMKREKQAIQEADKMPELSQEQYDALLAQKDSVDKLTGMVTKLQADNQNLHSDNAALKARVEVDRVTALLDESERTGKTTAAQRPNWKALLEIDFDKTKATIEGQPADPRFVVSGAENHNGPKEEVDAVADAETKKAYGED
jgi:ATP-dependent Clp protease protease subunit